MSRTEKKDHCQLLCLSEEHRPNKYKYIFLVIDKRTTRNSVRKLMYQDNNPLLPFSSAHHYYYILMPIWYLQIHWRDTNFWEEKVLQIRNRLFLHTNVPEALRIRTSKKTRVCIVKCSILSIKGFFYSSFLSTMQQGCWQSIKKGKKKHKDDLSSLPQILIFSHTHV